MSASWPVLPQEHNEPVTVGGLLWPCPVCDLPIPVTIEAARIRDEDGDDCVWIEQNMADLELHALTHENDTIATVDWGPDDN